LRPGCLLRPGGDPRASEGAEWAVERMPRVWIGAQEPVVKRQRIYYKGVIVNRSV